MVEMLGSNSWTIEGVAASTRVAAPTTLSQKEGTVGRRRKSPAFVNKRQRSDDSAKTSASKRMFPEGILASLSLKSKL